MAGRRITGCRISLTQHTSLCLVSTWDIVKDNADGIDVFSYVDKDKFEKAKYSVRNTADMVKLFNDKFNYRYPWANYKQIIVKDFIYGGMENTSATVLNKGLTMTRK